MTDQELKDRVASLAVDSKNLYRAIATFHINDDVKKAALSRGYFVLQRSDDVVHTESGHHLGKG